MIRGLNMSQPARPATAPVVKAAGPALVFTSGTTSAVTFSLSGLTKGVTYNLQLVSNKVPMTVSGSGGSGGTLSGTSTTTLSLVVPAGSGTATVTGLVITAPTDDDITSPTLNYKLSTVVKYTSISTKWVYDHSFGAGWLATPSATKVTTTTGNQKVTGILHAHGGVTSAAITGTTVTGTTVTGGDVILNGVSLLTALSSYINPPAVKKYKSIDDFTISGLQNTYVGLTTDAAGHLYGATTDGFIRKIVFSNGIAAPSNIHDGFGQVLCEEVVLDLYFGSIPDYNNGDAPYVISPKIVIDLCFDRNLTSGLHHGVAFYVLFDDSTVGWVCKQNDGSTHGTSIFGPQSMPAAFDAITTNDDSTILYFISNTGIGVYSADPYTEVTTGSGVFPLAPTLLYSAPESYDGCRAWDIGYNSANKLLYVIFYDLNSSPVTSSILSLTTNGVLVQIASITSIMEFPVGLVVDTSGNLIVAGQNPDYTGNVLSVPANFIGVRSAYSTPITTTNDPAQYYAMTSGLNGTAYILNTTNNTIVQLIPA